MALSLSPSQVALVLLAQICIHESFEAALLDGMAVQLAMLLSMSAVGGGSQVKHWSGMYQTNTSLQQDTQGR